MKNTYNLNFDNIFSPYTSYTMFYFLEIVNFILRADQIIII